MLRLRRSIRRSNKNNSEETARDHGWTVLGETTDYCQRAVLAQSTFGRPTVNQGRLISRLRKGGRITTRARYFAKDSPSATYAVFFGELFDHALRSSIC